MTSKKEMTEKVKLIKILRKDELNFFNNFINNLLMFNHGNTIYFYSIKLDTFSYYTKDDKTFHFSNVMNKYVQEIMNDIQWYQTFNSEVEYLLTLKVKNKVDHFNFFHIYSDIYKEDLMNLKLLLGVK